MQQFLKPAAGAARAWIVPAELFEKLLVAVHYPIAALDPGLGRISLAALTRDLETGTARVVLTFSWHFSFKGRGF
jgi:hypothetical protein